MLAGALEQDGRGAAGGRCCGREAGVAEKEREVGRDLVVAGAAGVELAGGIGADRASAAGSRCSCGCLRGRDRRGSVPALDLGFDERRGRASSARHRPAGSDPTSPSMRAWAREPRMSWRASALSKSIDAEKRSTAGSVAPLKRPPQGFVAPASACRRRLRPAPSSRSSALFRQPSSWRPTLAIRGPAHKPRVRASHDAARRNARYVTSAARGFHGMPPAGRDSRGECTTREDESRDGQGPESPSVQARNAPPRSLRRRGPRPARGRLRRRPVARRTGSLGLDRIVAVALRGPPLPGPVAGLRRAEGHLYGRRLGAPRSRGLARAHRLPRAEGRPAPSPRATTARCPAACASTCAASSTPSSPSPIAASSSASRRAECATMRDDKGHPIDVVALEPEQISAFYDEDREQRDLVAIGRSPAAARRRDLRDRGPPLRGAQRRRPAPHPGRAARESPRRRHPRGR